jgi:hypothetical protein
MKRRIEAWLSKFQERQRIRRLRRQWRNMARSDRLRCFLLDLLLKRQLRALAASAADAKGKTGWFPALRKRWKRIARKIGIGRNKSARRNKIHPRCPASPGPLMKVHLRRRVMVWVLCQGLRFLRWHLGMQAQSNRSLTSSSRQPSS